MASQSAGMYIKNYAQYQAVMKRLKEAPSGEALVSIAKVAILPIQNAAIVNAPYLTGTLRRGLHTEVVRVTQFSALVAMGTDIEYTMRQEMGFIGTDARGRKYHQPARPFIRPAYDDNREAAIAEAARGIKALVMSVR